MAPDVSLERQASSFLAGGGEMGALIRQKDWSKTPLGPTERWPQSLRMMVSFLLANRFPLLLWWGPDYISIYNDAYRPILGAKHPRAIGLPVRECWSEIWHILKPLIDSPFSGGPATWMEDLPLEINRNGFTEETHFTVAYSPVPDETAPRGIGGVLATVHEITQKVVGERRVATLRDLGARTGEAKTAEAACAVAAETMADHPKDLPFALLYLIDGDGLHARLAGCAGIEPGEAASPPVVDLADADGNTPGWPLAAAARAEAAITVEDLPDRFAAAPAGHWADPPRQAIVLPIRSNKAHEPAGLLVAGVSARLRLDEQYRSFLELAASQIATAISSARAYAEERRRAEALAEIDRAKTVFFSNISHEFRTPLTLMLGPLEDALADRGLPAAERARLDVAHRNSLRLLKLVNSLLDFSRIEAGRAQASYAPTDLAALTAELGSNFRSACERAGVALTVDCPPLPAPVYVDRDMWEKIVLNLLSNAFKFTFGGEIAVRLRAADGQAELSVADTGVGIPAPELPRLFERFHRIEGQKSRTYEGSGIGLALVQELVRLHGGTIDAASEPGRGTTFTVRLPLGSAHLPQDRVGAEPTLASSAIRAEAFVEEALRWLPDGMVSDIAPANTSDAAAGLPTRHAGARILLADDNADMRAYVRRLLGDCDVETVADGEAALAAIRARHPDLVLTDIMMPRLDGFGLIRAIRADPALRDIPLVVLSARAGEESRIEGVDAGADDYLVKPFSARELIARVGANLEAARLRRAMQQDLLAATTELRQTLETAGVGLTHCSRELRYLSANPAYARIAGLPVERIVGRPIVEVMGSGAFAIIKPYVERVLRGERVEYEAELPWAAGERSWVRIVYMPARAADGTVTGWVASVADITRRKRAEEEIQAQAKRLAAELAVRRQLQETSTQLLRDGDAAVLYERIVATAATVMSSDFASMQRLDRGRGELRLLASKGFDSAAVAAWEWVGRDGGSSCAAALRTCRRIVVPDVGECDFLVGTPDLTTYRQAGIAAVQSTPLMSRSGRLLGMISTHWRQPHNAGDSELGLLDVLARQAADLIEQAEAEVALRELNASLETRITERTRELADANDRLRRERLLSELIVENTAEGIIVVDTAMRHVVWNAGMERINGLPRAAVLGKTVFEVFPHLADHPTGAAWRRALAGHAVELRDRRYVSPARGMEIVYDSDHTPLYDRDGTIIGAICIVRETTERHRIEEMLRESQKLEAVARLTGGVAHDFNNLLTVVSGHAETLLASLDDKRMQQMAGAIQRSVDRGARLTGQLLAFSRRQTLRPSAITFAQLTGGVDDLVRRAAGETVRVAFEAEPDLWPIHADMQQFEAALLNLVVNARDAMPEGGHLVIRARNAVVGEPDAARLDLPGGDYVAISVSDTGTGMPAEVREHAFEPFFTTKDVGKGTGLGLAQIYGFAKQSGGAVTLESTMGSGTTVSLYLPRGEAGAADGELPARAEAPEAGQGRTVLLVEDQPPVREVIEMYLDTLGFRVMTAADGIAAQALLESAEPIDLLVTDVVMPNGVSGPALAESARRLRQDLRVVLVSGHPIDIQREATDVPAGFVFLKKPFRRRELAEAIARAYREP
ncbi:MAG TPA: ATP-binding protein [Stellaceae bacterium]|nr:ATP-binding protein [Stellaceae bacterium]